MKHVNPLETGSQKDFRYKYFLLLKIQETKKENQNAWGTFETRNIFDNFI